MGRILEIRKAREGRAERFLEASHELRGEMARLCDDLRHANARLEEARDALDRARVGIETSRWRMERIRRCTVGAEAAAARPRLRVVTA